MLDSLGAAKASSGTCLVCYQIAVDASANQDTYAARPGCY